MLREQRVMLQRKTWFTGTSIEDSDSFLVFTEWEFRQVSISINWSRLANGSQRL
jgi:hypothetical protein